MVLIGGLASRTAAAMPLDKVTGLTLQRTVPGRLLGYGTLIVASPGRRQAFRKVRYLPYPEQLYLEISALLWPEEPGGSSFLGIDRGPGRISGAKCRPREMRSGGRILRSVRSCCERAGSAGNEDGPAADPAVAEVVDGVVGGFQGVAGGVERDLALACEGDQLG